MSKSSPRAPRTWPFILVFAAIGFGTAMADVAVPQFVTVIVGGALFLVALASLSGASYERRMSATGPEADRCPRCAQQDRGPSGWCNACLLELTSSPLPRTSAVARFDEAAMRFDVTAMADELADRIDLNTPSGFKHSMRRSNWRCTQRLTPLMCRDMRNELIAEYADPRSPDVAWTCTRSILKLRLGRVIDLTCVARYSLDAGGRIRAFEIFAPLPARAPAATMTIG